MGRAVRGTLAGSLTTFLALAFHIFGGGAVPDAAAIVLSLLAAVWICTMLAGRRLRAWLLVVSISVAQLVLHTVFSMATATAAAVAAPAGADPHGLHQHSDPVISAITHAGHAMWAAHAAAGAVTVLGILFGDRVLAGLSELGSRVVARLLVAVLSPSPVSAARVPLPVAASVLTLADRACSLVARRGPPALISA